MEAIYNAKIIATIPHGLSGMHSLSDTASFAPFPQAAAMH